jgi:hypothetical protein
MSAYMGGGPARRNKAAGTFTGDWSLLAPNAQQEDAMADDREKLSTGPNERPINETIAGTGPGIPDDALAPGADLLEPPSDEEVERAARALGAPVPTKSDDTLPLDGE